MAQTHTSANTSINKNRLPAVYNRFQFPAGSIVLDYGCGKYTDHIREALPYCWYLPFDPYNQPSGTNEKSMFILSMAVRFSARPVFIICSNVLNVIDSDEALQETADNLFNLVKDSHGTALITVYEGDRTCRGRETGPDQWQRNERLRDYLRLFPKFRASIENNTIVIR